MVLLNLKAKKNVIPNWINIYLDKIIYYYSHPCSTCISVLHLTIAKIESEMVKSGTLDKIWC